MKNTILALAVLLLVACSSTKTALLPNKTGTFTDERDGQVYIWVKIGKQIWMAQNLNYKTPKGCYFYNNDEANRNKYGLIYDFTALIDACPKGWHVPSDAEWQQLEVSAGMSRYQARLVNYRGDIGAAFLQNGSTGFNLLYAGWHGHDAFDALGESAYFWTSTQEDAPIYVRVFKRGYNAIYRNRYGIAYGMSVRCVKDNDSVAK